MRTPDAQLATTLHEVAGGGVEERFQRAMALAIENLMDENTSPKAKRVVTIKVTMNTNDQRQFVNVDFDVTQKLAGTQPLQSGFILKTDRSGFTVAVEPEQAELPLEAPNVSAFTPKGK